jgi:hypothetical protein
MGIADDLIEQLEATWRMTRELIEVCPDEQWLDGDDVYFTPARQIYHLLDCAQCLCGNPPRPAPTPKPFGPHWDGPVLQLPTRQQLHVLLDKVQRDATAWISSLSKEEIIMPSHPTVTLEGKTPLTQVIYAIRHNQYHLAVVNSEMRRRDLPRMQWR